MGVRTCGRRDIGRRAPWRLTDWRPFVLLPAARRSGFGTAGIFYCDGFYCDGFLLRRRPARERGRAFAEFSFVPLNSPVDAGILFPQRLGRPAVGERCTLASQPPSSRHTCLLAPGRQRSHPRRDPHRPLRGASPHPVRRHRRRHRAAPPRAPTGAAIPTVVGRGS